MFPIHIKLPFLGTQYFYEGLYFFISFLVAILYGRHRAKKFNFSVEQLDSIILISIIGSIIGGRLSHFLFWDYRLLLRDPFALFKIWQGGISVVGGLAGSLFTAWVLTKKRKVNFKIVIAIMAPAIALGQAIGRVGCFLNGDAFGLPSNVPWAVSFPRYGIQIPSFEIIKTYSGHAWLWAQQHGLVTMASEKSVPMHPTQLYESFGDLIIMAGLLVLIRYLIKNKKPLNSIIFIYTGSYALLRFLIEFIRADRSGMITKNLSSMQAILSGWFVVCSVVVVIQFLSKKNTIMPVETQQKLKREHKPKRKRRPKKRRRS